MTLRRRGLDGVVVVVVVRDVAVVRPAQKPASSEIARDAPHRALENRSDLACRQVRQRVEDHRLAVLLIHAVEKQNVEVGIEAQIRACTLQHHDCAALASRNPRPLHALRVAELPLADGTYSYALLGVVEEHSVAGTTSLLYEVDAEGDVRARVTVTGGRLHVDFDPRKTPPPGQPATTAFGPGASVSARLAELWRQVHDEDEAFLLAMKRGMRASSPVDALPAKHTAALHAIIDPAARGETAGLGWEAAAMADLASFPRKAPSDDDRATVKRLFAVVPPADVLWDYFPNAIFRAVEIDGPASAYGEAFVRDHADDKTVGLLLLVRLRGSHDDAEKRSLYALLKTSRFAGTLAQAQADELDPDRVLMAGKPFPAFAFKTIPESGAATSVTPKTFAGKPYIVDVWATWCAPCIASLPHLREIHAKYGAKLGVLGVSLDDKAETIVAFRKTHPMPWPTVQTTEEILKTMTGMKAVGLPTTVLVDAHGVIVATGHSLEQLDRMIAKLLP